MSISKGRLLVVGIATLLVGGIITVSWLVFSSGPVASNYYIVPKVLVAASVPLSQSYESTDIPFNFKYPQDWNVQVAPSTAKLSTSRAQQLLRADLRQPMIEINRVLVGSSAYPLECQPNAASLEDCAGKPLATGAFLDLHMMYHREAAMTDIIAAAQKSLPDPKDIDESPIKLAGQTIYEWKGLSCGPKCYVLRTLILPLGEHQTLQLFANVYIQEALDQQQLALTLRSYQEQLDAIIASIVLK